MPLDQGRTCSLVGCMGNKKRAVGRMRIFTRDISQEKAEEGFPRAQTDQRRERGRSAEKERR